MKSNKKNWLVFCTFLIVVVAITLFGLVNIKNKTEDDDFVPTPQIESVFDTTVTEQFGVVFYKKGCPYCEAAKSTVLELAPKANYPVYYIDTQSDMGKKLIPITKIKYASTIVIFNFNQDNRLPISQILFSKNYDESREFNTELWSYADDINGNKVALIDNIKKAFGIQEQ